MNLESFQVGIFLLQELVSELKAFRIKALEEHQLEIAQYALSGIKALEFCIDDLSDGLAEKNLLLSED